MAATSTTADRSGFEHSEVAERMRADALGVAGFVTKPFEPAALVALLSGVIERTGAA